MDVKGTQQASFKAEKPRFCSLSEALKKSSTAEETVNSENKRHFTLQKNPLKLIGNT